MALMVASDCSLVPICTELWTSLLTPNVATAMTFATEWEALTHGPRPGRVESRRATGEPTHARDREKGALSTGRRQDGGIA
jgi:hypothetical protein